MKYIASTIYLATLLILFLLPISDLAAAKLKRIQYKIADGTRITAYIMRPKRRGRFPAIVALHGCSGLKSDRYKLLSRHEDWGKRFVRWGYVVLFPDSYGSRGVGSLCKYRNRSVTHSDRIKDAISARTWLRRQRFVNSRNITILGWSNGGSTVLRLAYSKKGTGFRQAIAFYPGCRSMVKKSKIKQRIPLTILMGKKDDWTAPEPCQKLVWSKGGHIILYDRAYHGFDIPNAKLRTRLWLAYTKRGDGIAHVGTNKKARQQAIKDVRRLLKLK